MKRWSEGEYCSWVSRQLQDDAGGGGLSDETPHILCTSSRKYSLYFSLCLLSIHRLTLWYTEYSRDVFHLSYAVNRRTIMHSFHFSLSSRMFDVFPKFKRKIDSIKIHVRKCWVAVRLRVWTVICILSSEWIMVRWLQQTINYVNLKGK